MSLFIPFIKANGKLEQVNITIGIVGSRKISSEDDYCSGRWVKLAPNLTIYGFEVDTDACDSANENLAVRQVNW
jgi:hypothetical protein